MGIIHDFIMYVNNLCAQDKKCKIKPCHKLPKRSESKNFNFQLLASFFQGKISKIRLKSVESQRQRQCPFFNFIQLND